MKSGRHLRRAARTLYRCCLRDGVLDEGRVRLVAQQLAASRRRGALAILTDFQRLVRLDHDRHTAIVESATALAASAQQQVRADLTRRYGGGLDTRFAENPGLIAGMRIKVGSDVFDGSVRAKLASLETRIARMA